MDFLLKVLEEAKERVAEATTVVYPDQEPIEDHYATNINKGWSKLSEYFSKLDDSPAYYAAVVLHPRYKRFCQNAWRDRPQWLLACEASFQKLWLEYKTCPVAQSATSPRAAPVRSSDFADYLSSFTGTETSPDDADDLYEDEYDRWKVIPPVKEGHEADKDPISWWRVKRSKFPRLSRLALDILTIPASSADIERAFSEAGDMLEPRRSRLSPDIIAALQCLRSWDRNNFISW